MEHGEASTRRDVLRKAAFVSPLILTLPVLPSFAKAGSTGGDDTGHAIDHHSNGHS